MASIFLSYVREDERRAAALARLLEGSGHSVWWDRQIKGGAQYARVIEEALASAERVVVLWSAGSVDSAWVRDEAAAGRDTGRLIPVTLDGTDPPLGFRQYQTVNLSRWKGRGTPPEFETLLSAVSAAPVLGSGGAPRRLSLRGRVSPAVYVIGLMLAVAAIAGYLLLGRGGPHVATVLVQPANDAPASVAAARDLSTKLASMEAANSGAFRLTSGGAGQARKADLVLQISGDDGGAVSSRNLTILHGNKRAILWAGHFEQPRDKAGDLPAQIGVAAAQVLSCAMETLSERTARLSPETTKVYLNACSQLTEEFDETSSKLVPMFERVTRDAPKFVPAWGRLLYSEAIEVDGEPGSPLLEPLKAHLEKAKRAGIETSSIYLAQAAVLPSNLYFEKLDFLERGLAKHPDDPILESALGDWLMRVGRQNDAVEHARRAAELDPISPAVRMRYIWTLAHSGKPAALNELQKAERLWPGASNMQLARFSYELRYGDPRVALKMTKEGSGRWGEEALVAFIEARIDPTKANIDRAVAVQEQLHRQIPQYISGLVVTLATFGRNEEALRALLAYKHPEAAGYNSEGWFRAQTRGMRRDPQFMRAMAEVGLAGYWKRSGKWPDFCFDPDLPYDCKTEAAKYV